MVSQLFRMRLRKDPSGCRKMSTHCSAGCCCHSQCECINQLQCLFLCYFPVNCDLSAKKNEMNAQTQTDTHTRTHTNKRMLLKNLLCCKLISLICVSCKSIGSIWMRAACGLIFFLQWLLNVDWCISIVDFPFLVGFITPFVSYVAVFKWFVISCWYLLLRFFCLKKSLSFTKNNCYPIFHIEMGSHE